MGCSMAHQLVAVAQSDLATRIDSINEWIPLGEVVARQGTIPKGLIAQMSRTSLEKLKRTAPKSTLVIAFLSPQSLLTDY